MARLFKRKPDGPWWADYLDSEGVRKRISTGCNDKQSAKKILDRLKSEARLVEFGVQAAIKDGGPIEGSVQAFRTAMVAADNTDQHVDRTVQLVRAVVAYNSWTYLKEIEPSGLNSYCEYLKKNEGQANRTLASVITAVRTFCRWCVLERALPSDPTASIVKPSDKTDRRIERRMVLPAEWQWIKKTLRAESVDRNGQSSRERLLMYWTAIETGLRSSELRSLTKGSLRLDDPEPHVLVKAGLTKNDKIAKQYVSDQLRDELLKFTARKTPGASVFSVRDRTLMAKTLRMDVADARLRWSKTPEGKKGREGDFLRTPNSQGEVLDFHALRHTCGAWLVQSGVTLSEVKEIMRHSTITLTIDCYGHLAPDARSRSRGVLGSMLA